jgi:hypothetical protein
LTLAGAATGFASLDFSNSATFTCVGNALHLDQELECNGTLDADGVIELGDGGDNFSVASDGIDISAAGALSSVISVTFSNSGAFTCVGAAIVLNQELEVDGTFDADGVIELGDGGDNFSLASDGLDISTAGALSQVSAVTFTNSAAITCVGADNLTITEANIALVGAVTATSYEGVTAANLIIKSAQMPIVMTATDQQYCFRAPYACTITAVNIISDTATTGSDSGTNWSVYVVNLTQTENLGNATNTGGTEMSADTSWPLLIESNATVAAGDVLELNITSNGVPLTDLSAAELFVSVDYN